MDLAFAYSLYKLYTSSINSFNVNVLIIKSSYVRTPF